MAEYKVTIGTELKRDDFDEFKADVKALDGKQIDIKINLEPSDIGKQISSQINKALGTKSGNKITVRPGVDIDTNAVAKQANDAFKNIQKQAKGVNTQIGSGKEYRDNIREIDRMVKEINSLSINPDVNVERIKEAERYLKILIDRKKQADDNEIDILDELDISQAREFVLELERVEHAINDIQARSKDLAANNAFKQQANEAKELYNQINKLSSELASRQKKLVGLDQSSLQYEQELKNIRELEFEIDTLKTKLSGFDSSITSKMFDNIGDSANRLERDLSTLVATNVQLEIDEEVKQETARVESEFKKLQSIVREMQNIKIKQTGLDANSEEYASLQKRFESLRDSARELTATLRSSSAGSNLLASLAQDGQRLTSQLDQINSAARDVKYNLAQALTSQLGTKGFIKDFENLSTQLQKLQSIPTPLVKSFDRLQSSFNSMMQLPKVIDADSYDEAKRVVDEFNQNLKETRHLMSAVNANQGLGNFVTKQKQAARTLDDAKKTFSLQIDNWLDNHSAAIGLFGDKLRDIQNRIQNVNNAADLSHLKSEFRQTTLEAQKADVAIMSFGDRLKKQFREYASYVGIAGLFAAGGQAMRVMAQNVLEVDTAMTGLYRVTDLTSQQYNQLYDNMISASKEYGATLTDTINATSDWVRAGYDADTALQLADITAMYQHISDLDYDEASKNLLTAYNGFEGYFSDQFGAGAQGTVDAVQHIADAFNELDNKFSITSAGLGEGLARSASALQLAGNTFEEAAA